MTRPRVAFTLIGGPRWTGGQTYLINLLRALRRYESDAIEAVLFVGEQVPDEEILELSTIAEVVRSPAFDEKGSGIRMVFTLLGGSDTAVTELFRQFRIGVVFESATFFGRNNPIPTIAWIPDFQHRRMAHLFDAKAYWHRELGFRAQIAARRLVMLSSEAARKDCERFYRQSVGRTAVVRFAATVDPALIVNETESTRAHYRLPGSFFYLPNQFWIHKNHRVVIDALALLKQRGSAPIVAASGVPSDPRQPQHFADLQRTIQDLSLQDNFRILGMIPRAHVITLMRTCTALLNPSYFEGWSSTVEEARSLGVPMILSNIETHREQMGDKAVYFDPHDPSALAAKLLEASQNAPSPLAPRRIQPASHLRVQQFAAEFVELVKRARGEPVQRMTGV